jgi:Uma2 family endonuclease
LRRILEGVATTHVVTDEDLLRLPRDGRKYELVDGAIRMSPAGLRHEEIVVRLIARLLETVRPRQLGKVFGSSAGYRLPGGNVRSPDVSFVAEGRLPGGTAPEGFGELAPDLAVEVLSPEDQPREILDKVGEYLAAGVRLVWVIDPRKRRAAVHRSLTNVQEIAESGALEGQDVLPGFSCPLADILA